MSEHRAAGREPIPCHAKEGLRCRICELIDRDGPHYQESYRRLFHPEEFGGDPVPMLAEPGFFDKAVGLGKAVINHAVAGFPEADEATHAARLATCRACEFLDAERMVCLKCGCFTMVKTKWETQTCPIGKW